MADAHVYIVLEYTYTGHHAQRPAVVGARAFTSPTDAARYGVATYMVNVVANPFARTLADMHARDVSLSPPTAADTITNRLHAEAHTAWRTNNLYGVARRAHIARHREDGSIAPHLSYTLCVLIEAAFSTSTPNWGEIFNVLVQPPPGMPESVTSYALLRRVPTLCGPDNTIMSLVWRMCNRDPPADGDAILLPHVGKAVRAAVACTTTQALLSTLHDSMATFTGTNVDLRTMSPEWWWYAAELDALPLTNTDRAHDLMVAFARDPAILDKKDVLADSSLLAAMARAVRADEGTGTHVAIDAVDWRSSFPRSHHAAGVCQGITMIT
jgi:post-segregation antitoxin (ccd killing protein)